jgi:hypothetical protein
METKQQMTETCSPGLYKALPAHMDPEVELAIVSSRINQQPTCNKSHKKRQDLQTQAQTKKILRKTKEQ